MYLKEARTLAIGLMSQYELFNWRFKFDRAKKTLWAM